MNSVRNRKNAAAMASLVTLALLAASCAVPATLGQKASGVPGATATRSSPTGGKQSIAVGASALTSTTMASTTMKSNTTTSASTTSTTSTSLPAAPPHPTPLTSKAPEPTSRITTPETMSTVPKRTPVFGTPTHPIRVQVTGMVLADQHGNVVMCPPFPDGGLGYTSALPPTPQCLQGKPVTGVDMDRVAVPGHNSTHRWGGAHIDGTWDGRRLVATSQRRPADTDRHDVSGLPDGVPCPTPSGGWDRGPIPDENSLDKVPAAVGPSFGMLMIGVPKGFPTSGSADPSTTVQVVIVGVTGDQTAAATAIRRVFDGNLCMAHSDTTDAEIRAQNDAIGKALGNMNDYGVMGYGQQIKTFATQTNEIDLVVDTPDFEARMANISGPAITINPWIIPLP